jgi:hypothetical protein
VDLEAHFAGVKANDSIGMGSAIVQVMGEGLGGGFVPFALADASLPRVTRRVESTARA